MQIYKQINIDNFDYNLPDSKIAKFPELIRDRSKLLVNNKGKVSQTFFFNIVDYLPENSLIVFNDTKVIKARLNFTKATGSGIEIFCLEPISPADYSLSFASTTSCVWKCLIGNNKKWKTDKLEKKILIASQQIILTAERKQKIDNAFEVEFSWNNNNVCFSQIIENFGDIPIPPYLNRDNQVIDNTRYQTIYGINQGSVAAPTAGLHFSENVFQNLKNKNIKTDKITLHVGAGTFQPIKTNFIYEHKMHTEHFVITKNNVENLINNLSKIIVVGTTTVRTLESLYQIALQIYQNNEIDSNNFQVRQWEAYEDKLSKISTYQLLKNLLDWMNIHKFEQLNCATSIMIIPGYKFQLTNYLITNFHQPKSSLLLLLAAFIGDSWKEVYQFALNNNFRFLSYGDSCLFI